MRYLFVALFIGGSPSLPRRPKTTGRDQTPAINMFRATQPAAEPTSRRIIRQTRTAIRATTTALKAISTPTTGRQAGATEKLCGVARGARRLLSCAAPKLASIIISPARISLPIPARRLIPLLPVRSTYCM